MDIELMCAWMCQKLKAIRDIPIGDIPDRKEDE